MPIDKKRLEESYDIQSEIYIGAQKKEVHQIIRDLQIPSHPTCLDIGCGYGSTTFALYELCNNTGQFYGLDISQKMIDKASENQKKLGYSNIHFVKGDAESLDFPDNNFDLIISLFTLQFFPDKNKALREMYRVLKPGGRVAFFHTAGKDFFNELNSIFRQFLVKHPSFTRLGEVLDEYGEMHTTLEEFQNMVYNVGFTDLDLFGKHRVEYINPERYLDVHPYLVDWMLSIPEDSRVWVREEILGEMLKVTDERGFKSTRYFIQGSARKPS